MRIKGKGREEQGIREMKKGNIRRIKEKEWGLYKGGIRYKRKGGKANEKGKQEERNKK